MDLLEDETVVDAVWVFEDFALDVVVIVRRFEMVFAIVGVNVVLELSVLDGG